MLKASATGLPAPCCNDELGLCVLGRSIASLSTCQKQLAHARLQQPYQQLIVAFCQRLERDRARGRGLYSSALSDWYLHPAGLAERFGCD